MAEGPLRKIATSAGPVWPRAGGLWHADPMTYRFSPTATVTALALCLAAGPALSQEPMTAAEFEAYVTGKTLYYSQTGTEYGVEEYHPGRRVTWSFLDGACREGIWYQRADMICFDYADAIGTQCWRFYPIADGLRAEFAGPAAPEGDAVPYVARERDEPMVCLGPDVGA